MLTGALGIPRSICIINAFNWVSLPTSNCDRGPKRFEESETPELDWMSVTGEGGRGRGWVIHRLGHDRALLPTT